MEQSLNTEFHENSLRFKASLDRIIEKYSKTRHHAGIEVDLNSVKSKTLEQYMEHSRKMLNMIKSKSLTDLNDESLSGQNVTGNSQLDFTFRSAGADRTCSSTSNSAMENNDVTQSSLDESSRNLSEGEHLPEDQDEELQMSLSSNGSSWVDLYPSMVSRIGRACRLQHVSEAAGSVLRRYQRWRRRSKRARLSSTFDATLRNSKRKPTVMPSSKVKLEESSSSPSPGVLQTGTSLHDGQQQPSPSQDASTSTRPVRVMDFSETTQPTSVALNETFVVYEVFPRRRHVLKSTTGPSQTSCGTSGSSREPSHSAESSTRGAAAGARRPDVYSSSLRQSPFKSKVFSRSPQGFSRSPQGFSRSPQGFSRSPQVFSRSPQAFSRSPQAFSRSPQGFSRSPQGFSRSPQAFSRSPQGFSRSPQVFSRSPQGLSRGLQDNSMSRCPRDSLRPVSLLSSPKGPAVQPAVLYPPSSRPQPDGHRRFRRHLSFDSSLSCSASYSPKKVDEEFVKLYHKLVCQNKSIFFNSLPCRFCGRSSGVRGHSSALAALALSPHRSVLWKRHRDMESSSCPKSKRHKTDVLMHCLSPYKLEQPRSTSTHSPSTHSSPRQPRAQPPAARQDAWMRGPPRRPAAHDLSVPGDAGEDTVVSGYSPR